MKTFWISFKQKNSGTEFTDYSEGENIQEAVERLGMKMEDVVEYRPIPFQFLF